MTNLEGFTDLLNEEIENSPPFSLPEPSPTKSDERKVINNMSNKNFNRPPKHTGERQGLRSVEEIDPKYREVFSFQYFNLVQTKVIEDALYSDKSLVVCAPTGSGKTVIFEMAIVQLLMEMEEKNFNGDFKIIYMAPIKAICTERLTEWYPKFTKYNALCIEVTGDTDVDFSQLKPYRIIITTPEKWDMLTRRWRNNRGMVEVIKLFLIDEVHILNDVARGPVLEAVVSRMKTIQSSLQCTYRIEQLLKQKQGDINTSQIDTNEPKIRFVAVSATISNPEDVAEWLGTANKPAVFHKFGDECRPVKLKRVVEGYPCPEGTSIFKFDILLNYKLWPVIQRYGDKKPTLIFCNTRKGVILTAEALSRDITVRFSEEQKAKLTTLASAIKTKKIQSLLLCGIGCHHAGLLFEERVNIERAFRNGDLPILITTTTLAMGVNLPAHLVIIKNTQQYVNGTYQEYSISTVLQMVGRAGRPQFDSEATAVIMTRLADKARYQALVGGCEPLQSYLHKRLAENLNSEVALGTVTDLAQCVQWVRSTFLFVRAARDPKMYLGLPQSAPTNLISRKIEDMCMKAVNGLESSCLITKDEVCCIQSTEAGRLLSIYYLDLETMKRIMKIKGDESLEQLLWVVCESHELSDMHLRVDERKCLNALNRNNAAATIRFPMKGKINTRQMKLNCIIQAVLGCLPIHEPSLNQEAIKIMRIAYRVCKCLLSYVTRPNALRTSPQNYQTVLNAVVLSKCLESQLWENSKYVSKQLKGIGPTYSALLAAAGKINFTLLEESHPRDLERIMNKGPPAGNILRKQISLLPKYQLTITPIDQNSVNIQLKLINQMHLNENLDHLTAGANHTSFIIIGDSENYLLILTSFKDKDLITIYDGEISYQIVRRHHFEHKMMAHCISSNLSGIDVHCDYQFQGLDTFHRNDIPISPKEKTNNKDAKQTVITDTFKMRKRKTYDPIETITAEKKNCDFAIIKKIKTFTQSHDKLSNVSENETNKEIDKFHDLQQDSFDVDLIHDDKIFTNLNEINEKEDDEQISEILNEIEKEILEQDKATFNVPQKYVPVESNPFITMDVGRNTFNSKDTTPNIETTCFDGNRQEEIQVQKTDIKNFSRSNKEEDDEQINKILDQIDKEILEHDKPKHNVLQKQVPVVSYSLGSNNIGRRTHDTEIRTTKTKIKRISKSIEKEKNNFNVIDKIQKKAINMTDNDDIVRSDQSTFANTVKNQIDKYMERAKQSGDVAEKNLLKLLEINPNKSLCQNKSEEKQNIECTDIKDLIENNEKIEYLTDTKIDVPLNISDVRSISKKELKVPKLKEKVQNNIVRPNVSNTNTSKSVALQNETKSRDHRHDLCEFQFNRSKEHDSNYKTPLLLWNTTENNNESNLENEQNISKDIFALEELQDEHENYIITNAISNIHLNHNEALHHEDLKICKNGKTLCNVDNLQCNTTKASVLQKLKEKEPEIDEDAKTNNEDKFSHILELNRFDKIMEPDYSNNYNESIKAVVPILSSNAANSLYKDVELLPKNSLQQVAQKVEDKKISINFKNCDSSSLSVIKNNDILLQPYSNQPLHESSSGYEYMKKLSFTKTQLNICTKNDNETKYCFISNVHIDLNIIKNESTSEKGNFKFGEKKVSIISQQAESKNDHEMILHREETNNVQSKQETLNTIQPEIKENANTTEKINENCEEAQIKQITSVPETCHTVENIINKYKSLLSSSEVRESSISSRLTPSSTFNKITTNENSKKFNRPFRITDLEKVHELNRQNTKIQPPQELDHSKVLAKILASINDSSNTSEQETVASEFIVEPDFECSQQKKVDDVESPDIQTSILDIEGPCFQQIGFFNDDLDQSMLNPKSVLESLAQDDVILPPLQFRDETKRDSPVLNEDLNDLDIGSEDTINLDDTLEKDDTSSTASPEIETWILPKDDESWANICNSATTEQNIPSVSNCYVQSTPSRKLKLNRFKFSRKKILKF